MQQKTVFTSATSLNDAHMKAKMAGYEVIGQSSQPGKHVVFARLLNARRMMG